MKPAAAAVLSPSVDHSTAVASVAVVVVLSYLLARASVQLHTVVYLDRLGSLHQAVLEDVVALTGKSLVALHMLMVEVLPGEVAPAGDTTGRPVVAAPLKYTSASDLEGMTDCDGDRCSDRSYTAGTV